jgi:hypothetical protein
MKAPSAKLQVPEKLQAPNFRAVRIVHGLVLGYWNFSGAWNLGFGASLS